MAASPLAQIDWNNLEGADANTVMNLLQRAFNERLVVARINTSTGVFNTQFFPFPDDNPTNTSRWGNTASLWRWTTWGGVNTPVMDDLCRNYADMTFINANINTVVDIIGFGGSGGEDDLNLTQEKVFNYIGITEWPRVRNPNNTALKQWYDILLLFTHVYASVIGEAGGQNGVISGTMINRDFTGIINPVVAGINPVIYFDTFFTPLISEIPTDWAELYTGPDTASLGFTQGLYISASVIGVEYHILAMNSITTINNQDLTDTGYTRAPKETVCFGQWRINIRAAVGFGKTNDPVNTEAYVIANDLVEAADLAPVGSFPTTAKLRQFPASSARSAASVDYQDDIAALTVPSYDDGIGFLADKFFRLFDNWNDPTGATGFQFYTP